MSRQYKPLLKFLAIKLSMVPFLKCANASYLPNLLSSLYVWDRSLTDVVLFQILAHFGVIKSTTYWTAANVEFGLGAITLTVEMYSLTFPLTHDRFLFCIMDVYAFSHKEFVRKGEKTNIFKSALDAFNIFDLSSEVWKNVRWLFGACILRRPYARQPEHATFGLYEAMNGKRDVAFYGNREDYAMLNFERNNQGKDEESSMPASLLAGYKPRDSETDDFKDEYRKPEEYSNRYGETVSELNVSRK